MDEFVEKIVNCLKSELSKKESVDTLELASIFSEETHEKIVGAVKSIQCLASDNVLEVEEDFKMKTELTSEGKFVVEIGSHEAIVFNLVPARPEEIFLDTLVTRMNCACEGSEPGILPSLKKIGLSKAIKNGWLKKAKSSSSSKISVYRCVDTIEDKIQIDLKNMQTLLHVDPFAEFTGGDFKTYLSDRKFFTQIKIRYLVIKAGQYFKDKIGNLEPTLTPEMLAGKAWKNTQSKNVFQDLFQGSGHLHPLLNVRCEMRSIFLEMGFSEMNGVHWLDSMFNSFQVLQVPRSHFQKVQDAFLSLHQTTQCDASDNLLEKLKCGQNGHNCAGLERGLKFQGKHKLLDLLPGFLQTANQPLKLFWIDCVFSEFLENTHLLECYQVAGLICDRNLSLGNLIGMLKTLFEELGLHKLRFKPGYSPQTEPSMKILGYHFILQKWMELGTSGLLRPELSKVLGLPENVRVIVWQLSLEKITLIRYGINTIQNLVG